MTIVQVNRRDFLLLRSQPDRDTVVLSCEQLYMRYADARAAGTTAEFFEHLGRNLTSVRKVRLIKTSWLADEDLTQELDKVFAVYRAQGGRIEH
jgi:hypothetical protein